MSPCRRHARPLSHHGRSEPADFRHRGVPHQRIRAIARLKPRRDAQQGCGHHTGSEVRHRHADAGDDFRADPAQPRSARLRHPAAERPSRAGRYQDLLRLHRRPHDPGRADGERAYRASFRRHVHAAQPNAVQPLQHRSTRDQRGGRADRSARQFARAVERQLHDAAAIVAVRAPFRARTATSTITRSTTRPISRANSRLASSSTICSRASI